MEHSGKFLLRIDPKTHKKLSELALREKVSLNTLCNELIKIGMQQEVVNKELERLKRITEKLDTHFSSQLRGVILFGSRSNETAYDSSDFDLLIVLSPDQKLSRQHYRDWDEWINDNQTPIINPHFVTMPVTNQFGGIWLHVAKSNLVLWDPKNEMKPLIKSLRQYISTNNLKYKSTHGQGYWFRSSNA